MALICRSKDSLACLLFMPDLVGEDSHTQLQVEVLRNLSSGLQGHPKNLSHAATYGAAVAGSGWPAGSGPRAGAGEGLPKVFPASSPREVGTSSRSFYGNLDAY